LQNHKEGKKNELREGLGPKESLVIKKKGLNSDPVGKDREMVKSGKK